MSAPVFSAAVRLKNGNTMRFKVEHTSITSHEQVVGLVKRELPEDNQPTVILVGIEGGKA